MRSSEKAQQGLDWVAFALEGVARHAGFKSTRLNTCVHGTFSFADYVAPLKEKGEANRVEDAVGEPPALAYPTRTPLRPRSAFPGS